MNTKQQVVGSQWRHLLRRAALGRRRAREVPSGGDDRTHGAQQEMVRHVGRVPRRAGRAGGAAPVESGGPASHAGRWRRGSKQRKRGRGGHEWLPLLVPVQHNAPDAVREQKQNQDEIDNASKHLILLVVRLVEVQVQRRCCNLLFLRVNHLDLLEEVLEHELRFFPESLLIMGMLPLSTDAPTIVRSSYSQVEL